MPPDAYERLREVLAAIVSAGECPLRAMTSTLRTLQDGVGDPEAPGPYRPNAYPVSYDEDPTRESRKHPFDASPRP